MKVALIQPNYRRSVETGGYTFRANPPLGLCYLASMLKENGIEVKIIDANAFNLSPKETARQVENFDIVGFSILTPAYTFSMMTIKLLSKRVLKIAGNAHASGYWKETLEDGFDIVVIGEGEFTLLEIVQGKKLKEIKGIAYKDEDGIHLNPFRSLLKNPNILPFPDREALYKNGMESPYFGFMTMKTPFAPVFTSRGCPYDCYFCFKKLFGVSWRPRTPKNIFAEIKELVEKYNVKEIDIVDDAFNIDLKRAKRICDMLIKANFKIIIRFPNGLRANFVDEEFLDKLKKAGCNYIAYGVESGNQEILNKIPKMETLEQIERAFILTKKVGIKTTAFIMFGLEGDTEKTMQETIDFTKKLQPDYVSISIMTPYPATKVYEKVKKDGEFIVPEDWSYFSHTNPKMLFRHPDFPSPEITEKMFKKAFMEFYLRPITIIRYILAIRSWLDFKRSFEGLKAVLAIIYNKN